MNLKRKPKTNALPPETREIITCVISAACQHFQVTERQLCRDKSKEKNIGRVRHLCYYIIANSGRNVLDYMIGSYFNRDRGSVRYGVDQIEFQKNIYDQTLANLNNIINIANNFDKKYTWHIPPISITR